MNPNLNGSNPSKQAGVLGCVGFIRLQRGFTLLEVMVVMVIMGIVAAIGIPSFADWRNKQAVRSATQTLMAHLKQARILALADNRSISIKICDGAFTDADKIPVNAWVFDVNSPSSKCDPCVENYPGSKPLRPCREGRYDFAQFSNNLLITSNITSGIITFTSRGTIKKTGTLTIQSSNYTKKITLNIIGRAYLQ